MKTLLLFIMSCALLHGEPEDLVKNRNTYRQKQTELTKMYLKWLDSKVADSKGRAYQYYKEEKELISKELEDQSKEPLAGNERIISINSKKGIFKLGKFEKGDIIQIVYVSGIWQSYPDWLKESPENPKIDQHRLNFVGRDDDVEIVNVPLLKTKGNPYEYEVPQNGEFFLVMGGINLTADNDGIVKYKITVFKN